MSSSETSAAFPGEELLALLRDDSVAPESIVEEMEMAGVAPMPAPALALAREILRDYEETSVPAFEGLPAALRALLVEQAIHVRAIGFLNALSSSKDKTSAKEGKRALHLLKARGVVFEPAKPSNAPTTPPPFIAEELPTFMSSVDGYGERVVFFSAHVRGGIDVAQIVLSDVAGIVSAHLAPISRKEYRRFVQGLTKTKNGILAEVPKEYARGLVTLSLDLNAKARRPVPPTFNDVAFILGPAVPPQTSPGHRLALPEDRAEARRQAPKLLEIEVLRSWMPSEDTLRAVELRLEETNVSPIFIDDAQRESARHEVLRSAVERYWGTEHRRLWAERLYDTGYLLDCNDRKEEAAWALATAHALEAGEAIESIPFCLAFFDQALDVAEGGEGTRKPEELRISQGGIILPP